MTIPVGLQIACGRGVRRTHLSLVILTEPRAVHLTRNQGRCAADTLPFVIPSVPGFPTSPRSPATTCVVLTQENHMQMTEVATLDRKSGKAEGSAVALIGN
jgi:hypothetical protein